MRTTIDSSGRLVVPKSLRDALGLLGGEDVEIRACDGHLEVEPVLSPMHLEQRDGGVVAVPDVELPPLTSALVREALEQTRS